MLFAEPDPYNIRHSIAHQINNNHNGNNSSHQSVNAIVPSHQNPIQIQLPRLICDELFKPHWNNHEFSKMKWCLNHLNIFHAEYIVQNSRGIEVDEVMKEKKKNKKENEKMMKKNVWSENGFSFVRFIDYSPSEICNMKLKYLKSIKMNN